MLYQVTTISPLCRSKKITSSLCDAFAHLDAVWRATEEFRIHLTAQELKSEGYEKEVTRQHALLGMRILEIDPEANPKWEKLLATEYPIEPPFESLHLKGIRRAKRLARRRARPLSQMRKSPKSQGACCD